MKITKEYLKKLVREAFEEEMGSEGESDSDVLDKLKERLKTMEGSEGYGGWDTSKKTEWYYDDAEGGYYHEALVSWENPGEIKVSASAGGANKEETFPLKSESDIYDIIKFLEEEAGLREDEGPLFKDEPEEEDEGMLKESVKRRFARLANIKHKK